MPVVDIPELVWYLALDLGQSNDRSALCAMVRTISRGAFDPFVFGKPEVVRFDIRHLERWPAGAPYPVVVARCVEFCERLKVKFPFARGEFWMDNTGVGRPVADLFRASRLAYPLFPLSIHGGDAVRDHGEIVGVPKRDLVAAFKVLFQGGALRIAEGLAEAPHLVRELVNFRVKVSAAGHDSYSNGGEAANDDLLCAGAMCAWAAQRGRRPGGYLMGGGPLPCPGGGAVGSPF
jgi:hypothetical protein